MIRQGSSSEEYDAEFVYYIKEILKSKSVTEKLSLKGCTEEDAVFCEMRMDFKNSLFQTWKDRQARWNQVREACKNLEPEEVRFSPRGHLTSDDAMTASSVLT